MSYSALYDLLKPVLRYINDYNRVPDIDELSSLMPFAEMRKCKSIKHEFVNVNSGAYSPRIVEAARILSQLRQRMKVDRNGTPLVGRIRADVILRLRPERNISRADLSGVNASIAQLAPKFSQFSGFQVEGWSCVREAIARKDGLVIIAPTGSGKTEVFVMPLVHSIASALAVTSRNPSSPKYLLLYPRVPLLKDQLARILRYVYHAQREIIGKSGSVNKITIGFQFSGIGSDAQTTRKNTEVFDNGRFLVVERCPICEHGNLMLGRAAHHVSPLRCDQQDCDAEFHVSIAKNDHAKSRPHILVTTAESLDRLYLHPTDDYALYFRELSGIGFDEVHLYHSLYGAHIANLIRRIEEFRNDVPLAKIAVSATITNPERFAAKLFYSDENHPVAVHDATDGTYPQSAGGLEVLFFLQSPEDENQPGAAPTLIQSVMAMGHGVLKTGERAIVFTQSLDIVGRFTSQIIDAEQRKRLWEFRTIVDNIRFTNAICPRTSPGNCSDIYSVGECWRGISGGLGCFESIPQLRSAPLNVIQVSSSQRNSYWGGDIIISTPVLEVGVDDEQIKATIHYLPPSNVFSFIQRRGRAGRGQGSVAYTLMILGNTPSDHFYFFRRNRLISGSFELPLNPRNSVVQRMHDRLRDERASMSLLVRQHGLQAGIWRWVWQSLQNCDLLMQYYGHEFDAQEHQPIVSQKAFLEKWIDRESRKIWTYLSLQWLLRDIRREAPDTLSTIVSELTSTINSFLNNSGKSKEDVSTLLDDLYMGIFQAKKRENDPSTRDRLGLLRDRVESVWDVIVQQQHGLNRKNAERVYDFLRALGGLYGSHHVLNTGPDTLKTVLQALFYLHLGLSETDDPCKSRTEFFIPNAFFQAVRPLIVELRSVNVGEPPSLTQEDVTLLSTMLIPYKTVYRYYGTPSLSLVSTRHDPSWVDGNRVYLELDAEGVQRGNVLEAQKVTVQPIASDQQGQQVVNFCPKCYAVYSLSRSRPCHAHLITVKLYASPLLIRGCQPDESARERVCHTIRFEGQLSGTTTVLGSTVQAYTMFYNNMEFFRAQHVAPIEFEAQYRTPVYYSLPTKGISWNLSDCINDLLCNDALRASVRAITSNGLQKQYDEFLILHTAAHMLQRAIASISGVNEQSLEYWSDVDNKSVYVWERYEGGAGLSEIFVTALKSSPVAVFKELLSSVLCPVHFAEQVTWTKATLATELSNRWRLAKDDDLIQRVVEDSEAERHSADSARIVCGEHDGCPACIHTTYCTDRRSQSMSVSRLVGEALLAHFVQRLDRDRLENLTNNAIGAKIVPPSVLYADPVTGVFDVLLL